jgi:hypothetical protein
MANRRQHERTPCSDKVIVKVTPSDSEGDPEGDSEGKHLAVPVYLRDLSEGGFSGTLFGNSLPSNSNDIKIEGGPISDTRIARLVWSCKTIESVHMLGFKFLN